MNRKALIAGASGLIGSELLQILLSDETYDEVLVIVRKKIGIEHKKLTQLVIDFDRMDDYASSIRGEAVFCCLGSTRKKTPDKALYYKIDHDYPLNLARIAVKNGIRQFHLVSAISANPKSANFYSKMKGETNRDISRLDIPSLYIYEPSLLTGDRREHRAGEKFAMTLMKMINPLLSGRWKKYRSIPAATVARTMFEQSTHELPGKWLIRFAPPEIIRESLE